MCTLPSNRERFEDLIVSSEFLHLKFDGLFASHIGAADKVNDPAAVAATRRAITASGLRWRAAPAARFDGVSWAEDVPPFLGSAPLLLQIDPHLAGVDLVDAELKQAGAPSRRRQGTSD